MIVLKTNGGDGSVGNEAVEVEKISEASVYIEDYEPYNDNGKRGEGMTAYLAIHLKTEYR